VLDYPEAARVAVRCVANSNIHVRCVSNSNIHVRCVANSNIHMLLLATHLSHDGGLGERD